MKFTWTEFYNRSVKSGCKEEDFTPEVCFNAGMLIAKLNLLGFVPAMLFSSCLRSKKVQIRIYKEKGITDIKQIPFGSCHFTGDGADIADPNGILGEWLKAHKSKLEELGLYVEDLESTPGWCHIQQRAPKSGNRFFKP